MALGRAAFLAPFVRWASQRRFPVLLAILLALLGVNLFVPDPVPIVDEALLALGAILIGRLRRSDAEDEPGSDDPSLEGG